MIYFFIATPDILDYSVKKIIGQNGYKDRNSARAAVETEMNLMIMEGLPSPEFIFLYAYIVRQSGLLEDLEDDSTYIDLRLIKGGSGSTSTVSSLAISTGTYASDQTLVVGECFGYIIYITGAAVLTLPKIADGMSVTIITIGAVGVSIDPDATDKIWLDGTILDNGDKITNLTTSGDKAVLTYYSQDGWYASTNGWTDGS